MIFLVTKWKLEDFSRKNHFEAEDLGNHLLWKKEILQVAHTYKTFIVEPNLSR
jgi:hypothetical protein